MSRPDINKMLLIQQRVYAQYEFYIGPHAPACVRTIAASIRPALFSFKADSMKTPSYAPSFFCYAGQHHPTRQRGYTVPHSYPHQCLPFVNLTKG
jgi:hypothetical protein